VAPSTVRLTLKRLASAGLNWPLPAEMTDAALEAALFAAAGTKQGHRRHAEPDWAELHRELKRKHVTLTMLWDEYIEHCSEGYRYSRFCELYRGWASRLSVREPRWLGWIEPPYPALHARRTAARRPSA
jgi:transposase